MVFPAVAEDGDFPVGPGEVDDGDGAGAAVGGASVAPGVLGDAAGGSCVDEGDGEAPLDRGPRQAGEPVGEGGDTGTDDGRSSGEAAQEAGGDAPGEEVGFLLVAVGAQAGVAGLLAGAFVEDWDDGAGDFAEPLGELAELAGAAGALLVQDGEAEHGVRAVRAGARPVQPVDFAVAGLEHDPGGEVEAARMLARYSCRLEGRMSEASMSGTSWRQSTRRWSSVRRTAGRGWCSGGRAIRRDRNVIVPAVS